MPLLLFTQAAAPPEGVLLEFSHRLDLMLLPISDEVPLLLQRLPHPETPELRQLGIGEHVGHDQEQRATPRTTPLFPAGEVPLTVRTVVALRPVSQGFLPKYVAYPQAHATTTWTFRAVFFPPGCGFWRTCSEFVGYWYGSESEGVSDQRSKSSKVKVGMAAPEALCPSVTAKAKSTAEPATGPN